MLLFRKRVRRPSGFLRPIVFEPDLRFFVFLSDGVAGGVDGETAGKQVWGSLMESRLRRSSLTREGGSTGAEVLGEGSSDMLRGDDARSSPRHHRPLRQGCGGDWACLAEPRIGER